MRTLQKGAPLITVVLPPLAPGSFAQAVPGMLFPFLTYEADRPPAAAYPVRWSILRLWAAPHNKHSIRVPLTCPLFTPLSTDYNPLN